MAAGVTTRVSVEVCLARGRPRRDRRRGGRPGGRRLVARAGRRAARRPRAAPADRAHRPAARDRDRRRPRGARASAVHGLAESDRRLGRGAPALHLGPRAATRSRRCPARRLSAEWEDAAWREGAPDEGLSRLAPDLAGILERSLEGTPPRVSEIERLFRARGPEVEAVARVADTLRERACGDTVTYVINRNINYTNQCYFRCGFCGFSRGPKSLNLRGDPYILNVHEVVHRSVEAWERGATEVCLQGGIHPDFTGDFYVSVLEGDQGAPARDARARLHAARGLAGRPHARHQRARVPHPPARRRPGHAVRAPRPRSSTTACGPTCARTRCAPPSGPR